MCPSHSTSITTPRSGATATRLPSIVDCLRSKTASSSRAPVAVPVIDTVGAGDAFEAGHLCEAINGAEPRDCLDLAVRTGAFACLAPGDWEGYPRRDELGLLDSSEPVTR
ncbi:PfkB family carbohydrate kinase [Microbacterium sp. DT81.1]|uniref:PfkB family carbohydrate kinase n=1 Tax=Microbacterium sp. DT81.1 TaxID=3393413 RepID=UPI003CFA3B48